MVYYLIECQYIEIYKYFLQNTYYYVTKLQIYKMEL